MNKVKKQNNIEEKILNKILSEHIEPRPRWGFLIKNVSLWVLGTTTIVFGALSVAATIFVFKNIRWDLYPVTHDNITSFLFDFMPYFWGILLLLFLASSYLLVRKTKKGYRYNMSMISLIVLGTSISLGTIFYIIGFGEMVEESFSNKIPLRHGIMMENRMRFDNPEQGLILGMITMEEGIAFLTNSEGKNLDLIIDHLGTSTIKILSSDNPVRLIGTLQDDKFFVCGVFLGLKQGGQKGFFSLERKSILERNKECESIRPYQRLIQN